MMLVIVFFIGLFAGLFSGLFYLAYLTATDAMFVILPTGKTLGSLDRLKMHLKIEEYVEQLEKEGLY